ncbi:MAG: hypothetical protein ABI315_00880 [Bacteroidia bacterium]
MKIINEILSTQLITIKAILPIVLLILVVIKFSFKKNVKESPLSSLQKQLSSGKISLAEFERQKRQLLLDEDLRMKSFFLSKNINMY